LITAGRLRFEAIHGSLAAQPYLAVAIKKSPLNRFIAQTFESLREEEPGPVKGTESKSGGYPQQPVG
jgi:hypothetical protein